MPLNLSNRDQNSGHLFCNRRLRAAITRFSVRMHHDDRKHQAALALGTVFILLGCGWMALLQIMKPVGVVGQSAIVGNRDTGAVYALVDGRLHPALNMTSARLVTGSAVEPAWVGDGEIRKHPTGPLVGIAGVPDTIAAVNNPVSAWTVCDTAPRHPSGQPTVVTAIAGDLSRGGRAEPIPPATAVVAVHANTTYLIYDGHRTPIDLSDRIVAFTLGLDVAEVHPVPLSTALFDAMPATEPLVVPRVPDVGRPSRWLHGTPVGRVLATTAGSGDGYFLLLSNGIQRITPFVADLIRARTPDSPGPLPVSPGALVDIPVVHDLRVDYYPTRKLTFVDTAANPVTCVSWRKQSTDPQAVVAVLNGTGLPTPQALDTHIVELVRDSRGPESFEAQQVLVLPGAATFVASTSAAVDAQSREALFWLSPQGVRYGIESDQGTLGALGLDRTMAVQAPWPLIRTFAPGPVLSRAHALVARDTVDPSGAGIPVPDRVGSR